VDATFDGVILAAGQNGLILQAYLGRLGLRVLAIDRNLQPGGDSAPSRTPRCRASSTTPTPSSIAP